jgi:hypothetical protein
MNEIRNKPKILVKVFHPNHFCVVRIFSAKKVYRMSRNFSCNVIVLFSYCIFQSKWERVERAQLLGAFHPVGRKK